MRIGVLSNLFREGAEFAAGNRHSSGSRSSGSPRVARAILVDGLADRPRPRGALMPTLRLNSFELRPAFDAYLQRRGASAPVRDAGGVHHPREISPEAATWTCGSPRR